MGLFQKAQPVDVQHQNGRAGEDVPKRACRSGRAEAGVLERACRSASKSKWALGRTSHYSMVSKGHGWATCPMAKATKKATSGKPPVASRLSSSSHRPRRCRHSRYFSIVLSMKRNRASIKGLAGAWIGNFMSRPKGQQQL